MKTKFFIAVLALAGMLLSTAVAAQQKAVPDGWNIHFTIDYCKEMQEGKYDSLANRCLNKFASEIDVLKKDTKKRFGNVRYRYDAVYQRNDKERKAGKPKWASAYNAITETPKEGTVGSFNDEENHPWTTDPGVESTKGVRAYSAPYELYLNTTEGDFEKGENATQITSWNDYIADRLENIKPERTIYIFCVYEAPSQDLIDSLNKKWAEHKSYCFFLQTNQQDEINNQIQSTFEKIRERLLPQDTSKVKIKQDGGPSDSAPGEYSWKLEGTEDLKNVTGYKWFINDEKHADGKTCKALKALLEDQGTYEVVAKISFFNGETVSVPSSTITIKNKGTNKPVSESGVPVREKKEPAPQPPAPKEFKVKSVTVDGKKLPEKDGVYQAEITKGDSVEVCVEVTGAKYFKGTIANKSTVPGADGKWFGDVPVGRHKITFEYNKESFSITVNVTKENTKTDGGDTETNGGDTETDGDDTETDDDDTETAAIKVVRFTADGKDIYPTSDGKTYQVTLEKGKKEAEIQFKLSGAENIKVSVDYSEQEEDIEGDTWTYKAEKERTNVKFSAESIESLEITIEVKEAKTPAKAPASPSADEAEGGSNILLIVLIVGAVIVVGSIVLFKQLGNKVFKISLNDLPYNKALAPGEYKIDSSIFPDCQEPFTIILSTKKGEDGTGHYVQFKLMPNWTLFEGNRALPLNGECSDELQINTETYKIRTLKGTMEFKIDLKD